MMIRGLLKVDADEAIEWFKISLNGWIAWLFLTIVIFFLYYSFAYPVIAVVYEREYYENTQSRNDSPKGGVYSKDCTLNRLDGNQSGSSGTEISFRFPKYLVSFVDRKAELMIVNNSNQSFQEKLVFYAVFEQPNDPQDIKTALFWNENQVASTLQVNLDPCEVHSYIFSLRTPQLENGAYVRIRIGCPQDIENSDGKIEKLIQPYELPVNIRNDNSHATSSCLPLNEDLDNTWVCSEISGFNAFRHSAIEWLLPSPWSNGLLPLAVFVCIFLSETFAYQELGEQRFYIFLVSRVFISMAFSFALLLVLVVVPILIFLFVFDKLS